MKVISYSAPAKVILSGEHAVVYGKPAIVSSIDIRLKFSLTNSARPSQNGTVPKEIALISEKVKEYLRKHHINFPDNEFKVSIDSNIPIGRGLGSSAALSVAAVAAFLEFYTGKEFEKERINNLAYEIEKHFHKNPSGIDNTASCFGGLIYYRKEFEFLKTISVLNFKIPKKIEENLYLIDLVKSQKSESNITHQVGTLYNKKPRFIEQLMNDIEKTTKKMTVSIIKEDSQFFQRTLVDNQVLLDMLGIVPKKTKNLLKQLEPYGVGKITAEFILFYAQKPKEFESYCKRKRIKYFKFKQDLKGLVRGNE